VRLGRGQHEDRVRRWLLECLEESFPGSGSELVGLVDDVHAIATLAGSVCDFVAEVADVVDATIRGSVDFDQVEGASIKCGTTQGAGVARIAILGMLAVDGAVQDAGNAGLAGAARAREEVRVGRTPELDGVAQRARDVLLTDDVFEARRAPAK